jgi:arginyl-tRNA synthetase
VKTELQVLLHKALQEARNQNELKSSELPPVILEVPKRKGQGDIATTVAMSVASKEGRNPKEIAEIIVKHLTGHEDIVDRVEVAGPGFLNFTMTRSFWYDVLLEIEEKGETFGFSEIGKNESVQVEFVSANPTGPLHVGHGRGAVVGDVVGNLLSMTGHRVDREYYTNDVGTQMDILGKSTYLRYEEQLGREVSFPNEFYQGEYIGKIARQFIKREGNRFMNQPESVWLPVFRKGASDEILKNIQVDLNHFGVLFDRWFSEQELYQKGEIEEAFSDLRKKGLIYEKDGAVWLATSRLGDDKDRVVVRENGQQTYFASDIAYHRNKLRRGYKRIINIWGADHHGYIPRMKAMVQALGYPSEILEIILVQLVNLIREGKPVTMSTRAGEFVPLREVLEEVGSDVARFFFLMRRSDSPLDFDLDLAKKQSNENPVFYVQYAHARLCSVFRQAQEKGVPILSSEGVHLNRLDLPEEFGLMKQLALYPGIVEGSALSLEPHRLTFYLQELASQLHQFYFNHRIITPDLELTQARLFFMKCVQMVIQNALKILGVQAPERM